MNIPYYNPDGLTPDQIGTADGWRLTLPGEVIPQDAEYLLGSRWIPSEARGCVHAAADLTYRTRAPLPEQYRETELRWIPRTEREPTKADLPIITVRAGENHRACWANLIPDLNFTHWMPVTTPPIPPREKSQAERDEEAFRAFMKEVGYVKHYQLRDAFFAALAYARKETTLINP